MVDPLIFHVEAKSSQLTTVKETRNRIIDIFSNVMERTNNKIRNNDITFKVQEKEMNMEGE